LGPNILLSILFLNTPKLFSPFSVGPIQNNV
jgi:hypothetical protein